MTRKNDVLIGICATVVVFSFLLQSLAIRTLHIRDTQLQAQYNVQAELVSELAEKDAQLNYLTTEIRWLKYANSHMSEDIRAAKNEMLHIIVVNALLEKRIGRLMYARTRPELVPTPAEIDIGPNETNGFDWEHLPGQWVATWYGAEGGYLGKTHGAADNGLTCPDYSALSSDMPDVVTKSHYGVAMPGLDGASGSEFYCEPVKICIGERCVVATAVDVPGDYQLTLDGQYYNHIDVWPQVAEDLGIKEQGIVYGDVSVYVGYRHAAGE